MKLPTANKQQKPAKQGEGAKFIKVSAKTMWANLQKPNDLSGKYQVDLCNLSDKAVEALQELGVEVRTRPDQEEKGYFITCKSNRPITAQFPDGSTVDVPVGNGSEVKATIGTYEWTFKNKKGISPSLKKLVVTELVEYEDDSEDVDDEEEAV
jgi:hypothetical protein